MTPDPRHRGVSPAEDGAEPAPAFEVMDEASYVRPYTVTGGRTRPKSEMLPIEALVRAVGRKSHALNPEKRQNTVIDMTVTGGEGGAKQLTVMLKDYAVDAIRRDAAGVTAAVAPGSPASKMTTSSGSCRSRMRCLAAT